MHATRVRIGVGEGGWELWLGLGLAEGMGPGVHQGPIFQVVIPRVSQLSKAADDGGDGLHHIGQLGF